MIDISSSKTARIKNSGTDWWINEKAIVGENGLTYIVYYTNVGEIHIKEIDAKCSLTPSRDICLCRVNCNFADEHNSPAVCMLKSGRILVFYTGHSQTKNIRYRMTEKPYDVSSFGEERTIEYDGEVSYVQVFENTKKHEIWLFSRVDGVTWEFRYSDNEGETFSPSNRYLASEAGGLFYFNVRKLVVPVDNMMPPKKGFCERWFFALYGHPILSKDHAIRSGMFDDDGYLLTMDGKRENMNLYGADKPGADTGMLDIGKLLPVYCSPEGETARLLEVAPTLPFRVGYASFISGKPETSYYYSATYRDGAWRSSAPIAATGSFLAPGMTDGSQTYVGGMAYHYGVGEAGYHPNDGGDTDTNKIYLAREEKGDWFIESYVSRDRGNTYVKEQVIRKASADAPGKKMWRPIVPIFAQDNMPVYWHEGTYTAHSGGWHCDAVMYIEYDI